MFTEFLTDLLDRGAVRLASRPVLTATERPRVAELLEDAFAVHVLDVAGPAVPFDAAVATAAAELVGQACWFLVSHEDGQAAVTAALSLAAPADSASVHLSADVTFRLLPDLYRRARAVAADDPLTRSLEALLRQWPLSGVLSDLVDGPSAAVSFGGHGGLALLYAERLARLPRPAWELDGTVRPYIELAYSERGLTLTEAAGRGVGE